MLYYFKKLGNQKVFTFSENMSQKTKKRVLNKISILVFTLKGQTSKWIGVFSGDYWFGTLVHATPKKIGVPPYQFYFKTLIDCKNFVSRLPLSLTPNGYYKIAVSREMVGLEPYKFQKKNRV